MTDLFKCKKANTQCCAPKSRISEHHSTQQSSGNDPLRNSDTGAGTNAPAFVGQQQPANGGPPATPTYMAVNSNNGLLAVNPYHQQLQPPQAPNSTPGGLHYDQLPAASAAAAATTAASPTTTSTARTPVYSKYVCGVKGTSRTSRQSIFTDPRPYRSAVRRRRHAQSAVAAAASGGGVFVPISKHSDRLILGSPVIPIQIHNDILGDLSNTVLDDVPFETAAGTTTVAVASDTTTTAAPATTLNAGPHYVFSENYTSVALGGLAGLNRQSRVVGGEDGENGEWCWQVALINSMNQYLCGAALIGTQWVLTAAHCVTK